MGNSLRSERYAMTFAEVLENHSHLATAGPGTLLFLKSRGMTQSSAHLQICLSRSRNTVYLNVPESSESCLQKNSFGWQRRYHLHSLLYILFLPSSGFISIRGKIPFILLEGCRTSLC